MFTGLSNNLLKLQYHVGVQKLSSELRAAANVGLHSVLAQKSEINLND